MGLANCYFLGIRIKSYKEYGQIFCHNRVVVIIKATFTIFLYVGMIWDLFHILGKTAEFAQFLYVSERGSNNTESHVFTISTEILSWPHALPCAYVKVSNNF